MIHRQPSQPSSPSPSRAESESSSSRSRRRRRRNNPSKRRGHRRLQVQGLEQRQLLAADAISNIGATANYVDACMPRNIGPAVPALNAAEAERFDATGTNNFFGGAEFVNLGTRPSQRDTVNLSGTTGFEAGEAIGGFSNDIDIYRFDLQAGDILDISVTDSLLSYDVFLPNQQSWFSIVDNQASFPGGNNVPISFYPRCSPLQTEGNAVYAQVVPETGTYYLLVSAESTTTSYTVGLRAYRPAIESAPVGTEQIVFLDFDGGVFPRDLFNLSAGGDGTVPLGGVFRVPSLQQTLLDVGVNFSGPGDINDVIQVAVDRMESVFNELEASGINGSFANSGLPGSYGIRILNSLQHADPTNDPALRPYTTKIVVGGTAATYGFSTIGVAQSIDVGNFDLDEYGIIQIDSSYAAATSFPRGAGSSELDALGTLVGSVIAHEAGHLFGMRHTDPANLTPSLSDTGGAVGDVLGVGPDGIFGTADDVELFFQNDIFDINEGIIGRQYVREAMAHVLSTGRAGSAGGGTGLTGRVFNDVNGDGIGTTDPGLAGVTVFVDLDGDRVLDPAETRVVTDASGNFLLPSVGSTQTVVAVAPTNFAATTPVAVLASSSSVAFGFSQVDPDVTGFKYSDVNGNGVFDAGVDAGIAGAYIYADIDGDNEPDLGEPFAITAADGSYKLNLPVLNREYAIRDLAAPGLVRTEPAPPSDEHLIFYTGAPVANKNFGGRPALDFGDAPDSYLTSGPTGPSHGIRAGLTIGTLVDGESQALVSANADGDDLLGDDEDGVSIATPISTTAAGAFDVDLVNTTGQTGYLSVWVDLNGNDSFDPSEKVLSDAALGTGTHTVVVPAASAAGDSFARFRYSLTPGLGVGGAAATGEVEDHAIRIVADPTALANNDSFVLPGRFSPTDPALRLNVLANDLSSAGQPLEILTTGLSTSVGQVSVSNDPVGQQALLFTPPVGYAGPATLTYTVRSPGGLTDTATVNVSLSFLSSTPIALDDTFRVPVNSSQYPLNVLENDQASTVPGGISIASVQPFGSQGGSLQIVENSQSIRYTPVPGFRGAETFMYTVTDSNGNLDTAQVTLVSAPDADADDQMAFRIDVLDANNDIPRSTVQEGERFRVRVSVDDLRPGRQTSPNLDPQGVAAAFLDLLYTSELVQPTNGNQADSFPFDIEFGPLFEVGTFQGGTSSAPGVLDEVGSTQPLTFLDQNSPNFPDTFHAGFAELFTVTFEATDTGIAIFQADPADSNETLLIDPQNVLQQPIPFNLQRLGSFELDIVPAGDSFPVAIDDAYNTGIDSFVQTITPGVASGLRVTENDIIGAGDVVTSLSVVTQPANGTAVFNDAGTPADRSDDFVEYTPDFGHQGYDTFTYSRTVNSPQYGLVTSQAEVSVVTGQVPNPVVNFELSLVDEFGSPINEVRVGDRFGVQIETEDLRLAPGQINTVFAGFMDILYDAGNLSTTDQITGDRFDFDVEFDPQFLQNSSIGTDSRPGLIDEFGAIIVTSFPDANNVPFIQNGNNVMATVYFRADSTGSAYVAASPADQFPQRDTLVDGRNTAVTIPEIRYDTLPINVLPSLVNNEPLHNTSLPADVNGDNVVSPIDALLIINELSRMDAAGEPVAGSSDGLTFYHDVDGNGKISPIDALRVINYINDSSQLSGEAIVANVEESDAETTSLSTAEGPGEVVGEDESSSLIAGSQSSATTGPSVTGTSMEDAASEEDDEDDLLTLLADDVAGVWA